MLWGFKASKLHNIYFLFGLRLNYTSGTLAIGCGVSLPDVREGTRVGQRIEAKILNLTINS